HVPDIAVGAGLGFKPRCKRVPHSGDQEAWWALGDHFSVHQHQFGILTINPVFLKNADIGVHHRDSATRSVTRRTGRTPDYRQVEIGSGGSGGVEHFTASGADQPPSPLVHRSSLHTLDFGYRTLPSETVDLVRNAGLNQAPVPRP